MPRKQKDLPKDYFPDDCPGVQTGPQERLGGMPARRTQTTCAWNGSTAYVDGAQTGTLPCVDYCPRRTNRKQR